MLALCPDWCAADDIIGANLKSIDSPRGVTEQPSLVSRIDNSRKTQLKQVFEKSSGRPGLDLSCSKLLTRRPVIVAMPTNAPQ